VRLIPDGPSVESANDKLEVEAKCIFHEAPVRHRVYAPQEKETERVSSAMRTLRIVLQVSQPA